MICANFKSSRNKNHRNAFPSTCFRPFKLTHARSSRRLRKTSRTASDASRRTASRHAAHEPTLTPVLFAVGNRRAVTLSRRRAGQTPRVAGGGYHWRLQTDIYTYNGTSGATDSVRRPQRAEPAPDSATPCNPTVSAELNNETRSRFGHSVQSNCFSRIEQRNIGIASA